MKLENKSRMEKYGEIRQNKKKELDVKIETEKRKRYKKKRTTKMARRFKTHLN